MESEKVNEQTQCQRCAWLERRIEQLYDVLRDIYMNTSLSIPEAMGDSDGSRAWFYEQGVKRCIGIAARAVPGPCLRCKEQTDDRCDGICGNCADDLRAQQQAEEMDPDV